MKMCHLLSNNNSNTDYNHNWSKQNLYLYYKNPKPKNLQNIYYNYSEYEKHTKNRHIFYNNKTNY